MCNGVAFLVAIRFKEDINSSLVAPIIFCLFNDFKRF